MSKPRTIAATLLTAGALAAAPATTRSAADPLEAMRWERRVLVVFSTDAAELKLARQRELLAEAAAGVRERRLSVVEVVDGAVRVDGQPRDVDPETIARWRERLEVGPAQFRVILVGLDGGAKLRRDDAVWPTLLFETIDRMPMRRAEQGEDR